MWQGVHMENKENLNLGDCGVAARHKGVEDIGGMRAEDILVDQSDDISMSMVELMIWNCRGAASKGVAAVIRDFKFKYKVDMLVILEPRISSNHATKVIKSWGFKKSVRMEAEGFSGRIWLLWNFEELGVDVLLKNDQFIHVRVQLGGGEEMLFAAIYTSPSEQKKRQLWDSLYNLASGIREPWLLVVDFNEIKTPLEQKGGGRVNETRCLHFNEWIEECNLIDMETQGPFFTWKGPKWDGLDRVYKRLDRCLCLVSWQEKFEEAEVRVLPRVCSDHHPLLVSSSVERKEWRQWCFRYEAMWKMHDQFDNIMACSWYGNEAAPIKLASLKQDLIRWNQEVFGILASRKRRLYNRLYGIQQRRSFMVSKVPGEMA
ncbi:hypothetical protein K1719_013723 [Acacia pycnantha]|nr:hypothetical protein K1719_013723 [Acacia pycnantha]